MDNPKSFSFFSLDQSRSCESLGGDGEKKTRTGRLPFKKELIL